MISEMNCPLYANFINIFKDCILLHIYNDHIYILPSTFAVPENGPFMVEACNACYIN
jgi:hypothetical protein